MASTKKPGKPRKIKARPEASDNSDGADGTPAPQVVSDIEDAVIVEEKSTKGSTNEAGNEKRQQPTVPNNPQGNSSLPLIGGGLLAGAIGFGAAMFVTGEYGPFKTDSTATDHLTSLVAAQRQEIDALKDQIDRSESSVKNLPTNVDIENISGRVDSADSLASKQSNLLTVLMARVSDLENRPISDVGATVQAVATYEKELAAMRLMFAQELARVEAAQVASVAAQTDAAIQTDAVEKRVALVAIQNAVENGEKFGDPLNELEIAGITIPAALTNAAENGAPTLPELQKQFPDYARTALSASLNAEKESGTSGTIATFIRTQLGARSLGPREGDDADAILSRAEEALRTGNVAGAISELSALPDAGLNEMAIWLKQAKDHQSVVEGVATLSTTLGF